MGGGAAGRIREGVLLGRVLERLDRRIRAHIEEDVAGAGEIGADDADRRTLGEGAQHALGADIDAEIGAAGDHRLHGLAGARGAEDLERDPMLLEDAGLLAEDRRLAAPDLELADRDLERVLRLRRSSRESERRNKRASQHRSVHRFHRMSSDAGTAPCRSPRVAACVARRRRIARDAARRTRHCATAIVSWRQSLHVIPGRRLLGASPESIIPGRATYDGPVVMDSGPRASARPE